MRSRRRLWFRLTQAACKRVSSSCTLYEVFGNFAWRSAPPRKRVTQSEKAPALRDREVPPAGGSRRGARLRGNGDRGTCLTEGESFTPPMAEYFFSPRVQAQSAAHCTQCAKSHRRRLQNPNRLFGWGFRWRSVGNVNRIIIDNHQVLK